MKAGLKEIFWESVSNDRFKELLRLAVGDDRLERQGVSFPTIDFKMNVSYDDLEFGPLLKEKFDLGSPYDNAPHLTFVRNYGRLGFELPYQCYGYVSESMNEALVFASSFGIFKSAISGYASLFMESRGYVPAHASVLSAAGKGLLLTGGSAAGKTTTLLNLVDWLLASGKPVGVLTDDWAVVMERNSGYIAESFDPSISLKQKNLDENRHLRFHHHEDIWQTVATQKKVSRSPEDLYGRTIGVEQVELDAVILLLPEEGDRSLHHVDVDSFAKQVVDAAYHYPYVSADQVRRHEAFWVKLAQRVPVFSFSTRGYGNPSQSIDALKELIHGR